MLALVCVAFVAGAVLLQGQAALPAWPWAWLLVAGLLAAGAVIGLRRSRDLPPQRVAARALLLFAAGLAGFGYAAWRAEMRLAVELPFADEGRDARVTGVIASLPARLERGMRFEFEVEHNATPEVTLPPRIALAWYGSDAQVRAGERWTFTVRLRRPHGAFNAGGFDAEAWLLERNLRATGYVRTGRLDDAPRRVDPLVLTPGALVDRSRDALRSALAARLADARYGGVLIALVLGDQRAIAEADWLLFNQTGISHLVSISGLHITMIAGLAACATALLWRRNRRLLAQAPVQTAAAVAALLAALAYCLLAGWGVPAQRTFFMLATVALALLARVPLSGATTLALAAAVVHLLDPWAATAAGFWLSFGAVAAILWVTRLPPEAPRAGWRLRLAQAGQVQLAVTLALVPLTIALFQQVSLVSPLANAVAIPLVSLVVTPMALLAGLAVVLPAPLDTLAVPLLAIAHALFAALAQGLQAVVAWPWAAVTMAAPPAWTLPLALLGVAWMLAPPGWPLRALGAVWLLPMLLWPAARPAPGELWVTALDVGQGAAVLLETADHVLLYDSGPRYSPESDAGTRVILPYLRWRGIGRIDTLVISHLDSDHSGGAAALLRTLPVERVVTSIPPHHAAVAGARRVERCVAGQWLATGAMLTELVHPPADDYARPGRSTNAMSCVLRVQVGAHVVWLTGDISAREEALLLATPRDNWPSTLVAAAHHGSRHGSSSAWVEATQPAWALFQSGYRNRFGHPDSAVAARYEQAGAKLARSDWHGMVQWRLAAAGGVEVERWRPDRRRYWHNQPDRAAALPAARATDEAADDGLLAPYEAAAGAPRPAAPAPPLEVPWTGGDPW
jgi:competence protein ComEC